jgi:hypothetical protein
MEQSQKQNPQTHNVRRVSLCLGTHRLYARERPAAVRALLLAGICVALLAGIAIPVRAQTTRRFVPGLARDARTLSVTDTAHLHVVPSSSDEVLEEGHASGTLPGSVRAYLNVGPTVEAHFTIYLRDGSISGEGSGKPKGRTAEPSFAGRMIVHQGTGRYAHAHGEGGFYGTLVRKTYALTVQTTGTISF